MKLIQYAGIPTSTCCIIIILLYPDTQQLIMILAFSTISVLPTTFSTQLRKRRSSRLATIIKSSSKSNNNHNIIRTVTYNNSSANTKNTSRNDHNAKINIDLKEFDNHNHNNSYHLYEKNESIDFLNRLIDDCNGKKPQTISKQILGLCEQIEDSDQLQHIVEFLMTNTSSTNNYNTRISDSYSDRADVYLTSLLQPRDQTDLIRILGSRGMFYTMECFLKHIATISIQNSQYNNQRSRNYYLIQTNLQYAYTAAITALAKSSNQKYRMRSELLLDEMDSLGIPPNSYVITAIFLAVEGGQAAKKLIQRARQYSNIDINVHIYNSAIYACSRSPDGWQSALSLFREMRKKGIRPNQQTYASLLQACAKSGQVKVTFSIFEEMRKLPGMKGAKVWGAILRACSIAGDWKKAIDIILTMSNEGENINVIHMNSLLASLAKVGDDDRALDVLNAMKKGQNVNVLKTIFSSHSNSCFTNNDEGYIQTLPFPDVVSVNTVLAAYVEQNKESEALALLERMKHGYFSCKQGSTSVIVKPDIISYNLVISTLHQPKDAVGILHEIRMTRKSRYNPLKPTYQSFVNAISICNRSEPPNLDLALQILEDAREKDGINPNEFMYSAVIWTAERCGNAKVALSILDEMYKYHCKPSTICYNGVLSTLSKNGMFKESLLLFHEMKVRHIPASSMTFQQLAAVATKSNHEMSYVLNELETIVSILSKQERDVEESGAIYDFMIRGYGSIGNFKDALRIFNSLERSNRLCLSAILFVCSISTPARWNEALMIIHTSDIVVGAQGPGKVEINSLSYAVIACSKENQWKEALKLLELYAQSRGERKPRVSIDAVNSVIAAAGRSHCPHIAIKILNEMSSKYSLQPNERSFRSVIISCNQAEHEKRRRREKMTTCQAQSEGLFSGSVINEKDEHLFSFQWWEAALSLFRRMKENGIQPSTQTYSCVISACEKAGEWQRALGVLRSMTDQTIVAESQHSTVGQIKPNLYCYNAALAACEKGNAWLEAVELYERMKMEGGSLKPNFISLNSLLMALEKGDQKELAESLYKEALREKILSPWKFTADSMSGQTIRAMDLHKFSTPMAKIAIRNVIESLLTRDPIHDVTKDLVLVLGKGKGSIDGKTKLMPAVINLLRDDYSICGFVEESNAGRIRIKSCVLKKFIDRRQWQ